MPPEHSPNLHRLIPHLVTTPRGEISWEDTLEALFLHYTPIPEKRDAFRDRYYSLKNKREDFLQAVNKLIQYIINDHIVVIERAESLDEDIKGAILADIKENLEERQKEDKIYDENPCETLVNLLVVTFSFTKVETEGEELLYTLMDRYTQRFFTKVEDYEKSASVS